MDILENRTILFVSIANKEPRMGCIFALWTERRRQSLCLIVHEKFSYSILSYVY